MSKKINPKIIGIVILFLGINILYNLIKMIIKSSIFEEWSDIPSDARGLIIFGSIFGILIMLGFCAFGIKFLTSTRDKIIIEKTIKKLASVDSIKKSNFSTFSRRIDKETGAQLEIRHSKLYIWVSYTVEGYNYSKIKLDFTIHEGEMERFKDIKELPILVNSENYKDISIDWEWLGRDRLD